MSAALALSRHHLARMEEHARTAYPEECCGILVGARGDRTVIASVHPTPNRHATRARDRYQVDPREILRLDRAAQGQGHEVVGFYHSHPDHPPAPSPTDAAQAWHGYLYLIVAVAAGGHTETKAWTYDEESRQFQEWPLELDQDTTSLAGPGPLPTAPRR